MTTARSAAELLHVALEDLHAGKQAQAERLPAIAERCGDADLARMIRHEAARAGVQAERTNAVAPALSSPENLWMSGILDDAERDTRQTEPVRLLDVALIGAVRKSKAAEIVSAETALALASELAISDIHAAVAANRAEEIASDRALRERLAALTGSR
ncbi:Ferritin-like metal-binding protein YciE [Sphingomonas guangdongensis]|uniref:Ferritin-like metal-binding protein YciE n=1 Tax=Sphingomonas guangdongensis TaxID=1141890 RepID=A0A285QY66_9SPHN|nr:DUF892 family protein [Sphingomonas guangdongensis]SOB86418.1 Ferritin-like metal-binding protein YciE [Sphingomonas guangdongensis]